MIRTPTLNFHFGAFLEGVYATKVAVKDNNRREGANP